MRVAGTVVVRVAASITIGVFLILIFQKRFFKEEEIPAATNGAPQEETISAS
jgi:hypothetical protein